MVCWYWGDAHIYWVRLCSRLSAESVYTCHCAFFLQPSEVLTPLLSLGPQG
jgi:hypothetical protein